MSHHWKSWLSKICLPSTSISCKQKIIREPLFTTSTKSTIICSTTLIKHMSIAIRPWAGSFFAGVVGKCSMIRRSLRGFTTQIEVEGSQLFTHLFWVFLKFFHCYSTLMLTNNMRSWQQESCFFLKPATRQSQSYRLLVQMIFSRYWIVNDHQKSVKQLTTWVTTGRLPTITYMGFMFYTSQVVGYLPLIYRGVGVVHHPNGGWFTYLRWSAWLNMWPFIRMHWSNWRPMKLVNFGQWWWF